MKTVTKKAVCIAGKTAKNNDQQQKEYPQSVPLSRIKQNISHQVQRRQHHHGWFSDLLILTSEQIRGKGNLKVADYYAQLATNNTDKSGGIVT